MICMVSIIQTLADSTHLDELIFVYPARLAYLSGDLELFSRRAASEWSYTREL